jgi:hypothetical protein
MGRTKEPRRPLSDLILASPVPVAFDHFGGAQGAAGIQQPGFDKLSYTASKNIVPSISAAPILRIFTSLPFLAII